MASTSCFWEKHRWIYRGYFFFFFSSHMGICVTYFFNSLQYLFRCLGRGRNACPTPVKTWQGVQSFRSNVLTQLFLAHYYQAALVYLMYDIDSFPIQLWGCSRRLLRSLGLQGFAGEELPAPGCCQMARASLIAPLPFAKPDIRHQWWLFLGLLKEFCDSWV